VAPVPPCREARVLKAGTVGLGVARRLEAEALEGALGNRDTSWAFVSKAGGSEATALKDDDVLGCVFAQVKCRQDPTPSLGQKG
jgi:hypothetical protein